MGWVASQYLSNTPVIKSGSSTAVTGITVHVTVPALNVRTLPDAHSRIITVLFSDERVQVLAQRSGWNEVKLKERHYRLGQRAVSCPRSRLSGGRQYAAPSDQGIAFARLLPPCRPSCPARTSAAAA